MTASLSNLRIAWRNLGRNRRRTLLALAAIGLSQAFVLFYDGIIRGFVDWTEATATGPLLGDVQAHPPGWRVEREIDRTIEGVSDRLAALAREPGVGSATARVYAPALAALGMEGQGVLLIGLAPDAEAHRAGLLEGVPAGLRPSGKRVLLGRTLAEKMGATAGSTIALVGTAADGSVANDLYTVSGVLRTPVDFVNRQGVLLDLPEARGFLALGDAAHEIIVHARDPRGDELLAARLGESAELAGLEVLPWKALAPQLVSMLEVEQAATLWLLALIFLAAAAGVANTMLMATYERTAELGMLLALGARPRRMVALIVEESIALGLLGAFLGTLLALGVVAVTARTGLDIAALGKSGGGESSFSFMGLQMQMIFYPRLVPKDVLTTLVAVVATSILASIWPALRAARIEPVEAMRS